jgi:5'(3')-deoxyribonucleotidase
MGRPYIILSDVDGVLEQLVPPWVSALNEKYHRDVKVDDIVDWDITKFFPGLSKTQVFSPIHTKKFWDELKPREDALEYVKKFVENGDRVVLVTSAHPDTIAYKWQWINRYFPFISFKDIVIASNKQLIMGDFLIDDAIHNLEGGKYIGLLFSANHNKSINVNLYSDITRVDNWKQVYCMIESMHRCNWIEQNRGTSLYVDTAIPCLDDGGN